LILRGICGQQIKPIEFRSQPLTLSAKVEMKFPRQRVSLLVFMW
jgi:hypothetical protein